MEFAEVVRRRRMVRRYDGSPVPADALARVLDAASRAPSAGFSQGQSLVCVTDAATRQAIARCCDEPAHRAAGRPPWLSSAPVHLVPCVDEGAYHGRYAEADKAASRPPASWEVPFWWVDGGATLMLLLLAAVDEGLDAGFVDIADRAGLRAHLGIPEEVVPLGVVTLGTRHPDERPVGSSQRRSRRDAVHRERWGGDRATGRADPQGRGRLDQWPRGAKSSSTVVSSRPVSTATSRTV